MEEQGGKHQSTEDSSIKFSTSSIKLFKVVPRYTFLHFGKSEVEKTFSWRCPVEPRKDKVESGLIDIEAGSSRY